MSPNSEFIRKEESPDKEAIINSIDMNSFDFKINNDKTELLKMKTHNGVKNEASE